MDTQTIARRVLAVFADYALGKLDDASARHEANAGYFLDTIVLFVAAGTPIEACLPAFPFKSANRQYKVLGGLPDKAEELALARLQQLCVRVGLVYAPGARVTIVSDGITYNDLLGIADRDTWAYGEALRSLAGRLGLDRIRFARMRDLLAVDGVPPLGLGPLDLREITYVANCTNFRRLLLNRHGRDDLDIDREIATNPDTKLTYLGYKRFLESDLQHIFPRGGGRTANGYRRDCKYLAKQMLVRGYAFARAVQHAFPNYLRLSIHESVGASKISIALLDTCTGFTTPWHCSVAQLTDGSWISAPMGEFRRDDRLELVSVDGRPSHFAEKETLGVAPIRETGASYLQSQTVRQASVYLASAGSCSSVSVASSGSSSPIASTPESPISSPSITEDKVTSTQELDKTDQTEYGHRLLPHIMDNLAIRDPDCVVFSMAALNGDGLVLRPVTARLFARAVDRTTWWLHRQVGATTLVKPIGYIGPHDLRHILLTYACVKAGYAALFLSPKNSTEGALAVLEATGCNLWATAGETPPLVQAVLKKRSMKLLVLPPLDELLANIETNDVPFPFTKTFSEAAEEPFCFLHTSGSTGVPKPIPWSHALIGTMDAVRLLPADGCDGLQPWTADWCVGDRIYSAFPMSHGAGIIMDILMPALFQLHCVLGPANVPASLHLVEQLADHAAISIWSMVPSLVDELGVTPDVLAKLRPSKFICASGGPVSPDRGAVVNEVVRVLNLTGTTEGLFIGNLVPPRADWFWFGFHPWSGFEFRPVEGQADTYEHWVHRNDHAALFQGIFQTFPDRTSINLKDLYRQHPTNPRLWAFKGRSDDLVVLSNGYKIAPLQTEELIGMHPAIKGCLIFGTGRPQAGLLVELHDPAARDASLLASVWAQVEEANSRARHMNQLRRDMVVLAAADKPFLRTDKGTVKRAGTLALYDDFIERVYAAYEVDPAVVNTAMDTESAVRTALAAALPGLESAPVDADLFARGLDSLGVVAAVQRLRAATGLGDRLAPRHIYARPTVVGIVSTIGEMVPHTSASSAPTSTLSAALSAARAHQSFRLNPLDYVNPNHGMGLVLFLALRPDVDFSAAFAVLRAGLDRTLEAIPSLGGKIMRCSPDEIGYVPGNLCVTVPSPGRTTSAHDRLVFRDLSGVLPSFEAMRAAGFPPSAVPDALVLRDDPFPVLPADILVAQANFVHGGCLLAVDLNHCCLDGLGAMVALRAWADSCRFVQGDLEADLRTASWLDPESANHDLPAVLHGLDGGVRRPLAEIEADPDVWSLLPFFPPTASAVPQPAYPLHTVWPLPAAERPLHTTLFAIPPEAVERLRRDVLADAATIGESTAPSLSDMVQAFFWRSALRARVRVQQESTGNDSLPSSPAILEMPTDGRPYFSARLPSSYMGSMLVMSRASLPVDTLCGPAASVASVALLLRQTAACLSPSRIHDAFALLSALPDHKRFSTANMGLDHMHAMISNMLLFPLDALQFGRGGANDVFVDGSPAALRPQLTRGNGRFRFLVVFPLRPDGGIELVLGTHPEELAAFLADEEFTRYAELVSE